MKKLFTLAIAVLASFSLGAETVTFSAAEIAAGTVKSGITPYHGSNALNKNVCKDDEAKQVKADVCEVKNSADTTLVNNLPSQSCVIFSAKEKYITKLVVKGSFNSTGKDKKIPALYWKGTTRTEEFDGAELVSFNGYDQACSASYYTFENMPEKTQMAGIFKRLKVDNATTPTKKMNSKGVNYGDGQTFYVEEVEVTYENSCTAPAQALKLKADKEAPIYVGDVVTFSTEGGNGGAVTIVGDNGNILSDGKWTATEGTHKFAATQAKNGDYCSQADMVELTVLTKNPVTAVTIDGPKEAYVGVEATYTATAENATVYEWYVDGVAANTNAAEFKYTTVLGNHVIYATATNEFTASPVKSNEIALTVTELCNAVLIHYDLEGGEKKNVAVKNGVFGGTANANTESKLKGKDGDQGYKLGGDGQFVSLQLASGKFLEDDVVRVYLCQEQDKSGNWGIRNSLAISSNKDNTDVIGEVSGITVETAQPVEIVLTKEAEVIYLSRNTTISQNPVVKYIEVYRPCNDGTPSLVVDKAAVKLSVTDANPTAEAKVQFSGKNLTPGTYNLALTTVEGLSVNPTSVTVADDGKLKAEVTLAYTSSVDVEAAAAELSLTIGELKPIVAITYSAKLGKHYMTSVNIEQWVLNNGKKNAEFKSVLENANIDYVNINDLDSLDDSKTNRNEPYLGLKLKAKDAKVAGWLKMGESIKVKFGTVSDSLKIGVNGEYRILHKEEAAEILWLGPNPILDRYVEIITTSAATIVIKQIMINEDIAEVVLPQPTAIENTAVEGKAVKMIENGQLYIMYNGTKYNVQGTIVR